MLIREFIQPSLHSEAPSYSFTAPIVIPLINVFAVSRNKINSGMIPIESAVILAARSFRYAEFKLMMPIGTVYVSDLFRTISGTRKEFQLVTKFINPRDAIAGLIQGTAIENKIPGSLAPSILALSISSFGKLLPIKFFIQYTPNPVAAGGTISGKRVFIHPIAFISTTKATRPSCVGIIIVTRTNANRNFDPLKLYMAKENPHIVLTIRESAVADAATIRLFL